MSNDNYKTQNLTGSPWLPLTNYGPGAEFMSWNADRYLMIEATTGGISGGGTNPDGSPWGDPFTQWLLHQAEIGSTFLDGTVMWKVTTISPINPEPPLGTGKSVTAGDPVDNFYQNPVVGGTPIAFRNYIPPDNFKPIIYENWDIFQAYWDEQGSPQVLGCVQIVFNATVYLTGQGIPPLNYSVRPYYVNFNGGEFEKIKRRIARIATCMGLQPVTVKNAFFQRPNLVQINSPYLPQPGADIPQPGGKFSNI